jgi:hypothetical protein
VRTHEAYIFIPLCILGFIAFSAFTFFTPQKYTSPDENANAYFIKHYSQTGQMRYIEPLNSLTDGFSAPRNASTNHQYVVPAGFPGFIVVMGTISALSQTLTPYIMPIFGVMVLLEQYKLL